MRSARRIVLGAVLALGGACATSHASPDAAAASAGAMGGAGAGAPAGAGGGGPVGGEGGGSADAMAEGGSAGVVDVAPDPLDAAERADVAAETASRSSIDLSIWQLQLPTGSGTSPTTVSPAELVAGFSDAYFQRTPEGGLVLMDPATGVTTSGSQHCRTELREMTPDGKPAAWPLTGTNTMTVSGKVREVGGGASGHVTVAQVFNGTDAIPLCELEDSTKLGGFQVLYEEAKGGGTTTNLKAPVALGAPYTFTLALSNGTLTVAVNGADVYTKTPSAAVAGKSFYFKAGDYDQTAAAGPISTTPYTVVEIDALDVAHR